MINTATNLYCAYLRDSGGAEQELSLLQQEAELRAWIAQNGAILTRIFRDAARPGSTVAGREAFEEMISYLRKGGAGEDGILIWKFSRFSRDFDDANYFKADLRRRGYEIISLQDNVPTGPEGRLLESIIDWMNQRTLADMSSDIRRGKSYMVSVHKAWPGGHPPAGYRLVEDAAGKHRDGRPRRITRLEPDPATAPLVLRAFQQRAEGASFPEILTTFTLVTSNASLGRLLNNPVYAGDLLYNGDVIPEFCPPIVDRPTWLRAQEINRERRLRFGYNHPRALRSRFILTGLLTCAVCGKPMHARTTQQKEYKRYDYYRCQSDAMSVTCGALLIPKAEIEQAVISALCDYILLPDVLEELYAELRRRQGQQDERTAGQIAALRAALSDAGNRIERLVAAIEAHGHSPALLDQLGALEARQTSLLQQIADVETLHAASLSRIPELDEIAIDQLAEEAQAALRQADPLQQARVLRAFVQRITAHKTNGALHGAITYHLYTSPSRTLSF